MEKLDPTREACNFVEALFVSTLAASCATATLDEAFRSPFLETVVAWCVLAWDWSATMLVAVAWLEFVGDAKPWSSRFVPASVKNRFVFGKED